MGHQEILGALEHPQPQSWLPQQPISVQTTPTSSAPHLEKLQVGALGHHGSSRLTRDEADAWKIQELGPHPDLAPVRRTSAESPRGQLTATVAEPAAQGVSVVPQDS